MISACLPCTKLKIVQRFQNLCITVRLEFLTSLFSNAKTSRGYTNNRPLRTKTRSFGRRKWWRCGFVSLFTFHCFITTCANLLFGIITYYLRYLDPINYLLNLLLVANRYLFLFKKWYLNLCGAYQIEWNSCAGHQWLFWASGIICFYETANGWMISAPHTDL